jgi:hypothetical protein
VAVCGPYLLGSGEPGSGDSEQWLLRAGDAAGSISQAGAAAHWGTDSGESGLRGLFKRRQHVADRLSLLSRGQQGSDSAAEGIESLQDPWAQKKIVSGLAAAAQAAAGGNSSAGDPLVAQAQHGSSSAASDNNDGQQEDAGRGAAGTTGRTYWRGVPVREELITATRFLSVFFVDALPALLDSSWAEVGRWREALTCDAPCVTAWVTPQLCDD